MLQGLRTVVYVVADLEAAKSWYTDLLEQPPYFDESFYVGFNVGEFELGLQPGSSDVPSISTKSVTYWGVPDADAAFRRLIELGAREQEPVQDVGEGIRLGAVIDPFGNVLGVIDNPHFALST